MAQVVELLDAERVGEILGKHPRTVLRLARDGELSVVRLGYKSVRFRPEDVQAFIDRHVVDALDDPPVDELVVGQVDRRKATAT